MIEIRGGEKAAHEVGQIIYIDNKKWVVTGVTPSISYIEPVKPKGSGMKKYYLMQIFLSAMLTIVSITLVVVSCSAKADEIYLKVGAGYKIDQTDHFYNRTTQSRFDMDFNDPLSARIEIGVESGNITYGISHHSNWLSGYPFNDDGEVQKTEIFIDYKFSWGI